MKRQRSWIVGIVLVLLASCIVTAATRRPSITKEAVTQHLRTEMTVAQIEQALSLPSGSLILREGNPGEVTSVLVDGSNFLSLVTPQDQITLIFDENKRLRRVWWESVLRADEVREAALPLAEVEE